MDQAELAQDRGGRRRAVPGIVLIVIAIAVVGALVIIGGAGGATG